MCEPARPSAPSSAADAVAMARTALAWLACADVTSLPPAVQGDCLRALGDAESLHLAARTRMLTAYRAQAGYEEDGHGSAATWLTWQTRVTSSAAGAAVAWTRRLAAHPAIATALATAAISASWARAICAWSDQLPEASRPDADAILLAAAAGGAELADLAALAQQIRARTAGPDRDADGFEDRWLRLEQTLDGTGSLQGQLTSRCAAALEAVLGTLGRKRGPEDTRSRSQRDHDALEEACRRLLAAGCLPARAGQPVQLQVHMTLDDLLGRPGASDEPAPDARGATAPDTPGAGRPVAGRPATARPPTGGAATGGVVSGGGATGGATTGGGATAGAATGGAAIGGAAFGLAAGPGDECDAAILPVVTGHIDPTILDRLAAAVLHGNGVAESGPVCPGTAAGPAGPGHSCAGNQNVPGTCTAPGHQAARAAEGAEQAGTAEGAERAGTAERAVRAGTAEGAVRTGTAERAERAGTAEGAGTATESPASRMRAERAARQLLVRWAVALLSGPFGLAAALRTGLPHDAVASVSLPLDVGALTDTIPVHLRRAVTVRDPRCRFPGCDQPAAACQPHHVVPRARGGPTSLGNLINLCAFHHLTVIHRWGWAIRLHADGTVTATSPEGSRVLRSHSPPARAA